MEVEGVKRANWNRRIGNPKIGPLRRCQRCRAALRGTAGERPMAGHTVDVKSSWAKRLRKIGRAGSEARSGGIVGRGVMILRRGAPIRPLENRERNRIQIDGN